MTRCFTYIFLGINLTTGKKVVLIGIPWDNWDTQVVGTIYLLMMVDLDDSKAQDQPGKYLAKFKMYRMVRHWPSLPSSVALYH